MTSRIVIDTEANGFLYDVTKIHCICAEDLETDEVFKFPPSQIEQGLELLESYDIIIGHNICGYDIPLIKKFYPNFKYKKLRDSLCMSKLFNPERLSHSIESYGRQFGKHKPVHEDWTVYSEEMLFRCSEDVGIGVKTYRHLVDKYCKGWDWSKALDIEQEFVLYRAAQEVAGIDIDTQLAREVLTKLDIEIQELDTTLLERIPKKVVAIGSVEGNKPFKKNGEYTMSTKEWFDK